jgi:cation diffusion facilitator family transporter
MANPFELPEGKRRAYQSAKRLEWVSLGFNSSIIVVMYLPMGSSQAMRTAWMEDLLAPIAPVGFLITTRIQSRPPNHEFPYGYHRCVSIVFLIAAAALFAMGASLLYVAIESLISAGHPTVGTVEIFGRTVWMGWLMIAALLYSAIPLVILGRMKIPIARELHDKALHADAEMNRADWLTAVAAMVGIVGLGFGWWWVDGAAAAFISVEVLRDGFRNLKIAVFDLMDKAPTTVSEERRDPLAARVESSVRKLEWVEDAAVRLREEGHVYCGEVFVVPRHGANLLSATEKVHELATGLDWRLHMISR